MGKAGYEGKCDKCGDDLPEIMELKVKPEEGGGERGRIIGALIALVTADQLTIYKQRYSDDM